MDIVVFASAYWDEPLWTNKQHIAARLVGRGHRVLYVEPGFSRPVLRGRLAGRADAGGPGSTPLPLCGMTRSRQGVWVLSTLCLPLRRGPGILLWFSWRALARRLRRAMATLGFAEQWVYLVYYPEGVRLLRLLNPAVTLYDCVDDIASQPHIAARPALAASLRATEAKLVAEATCVTATSRPLWELRRQENARTYYVPNVGEYDHFAHAQNPLPAPPELAGLPHPRLFFVGALDPYKVDYDILSELARRLPEVSLVLAGPAETAGKNPQLAELCALPNVRFLGPWPYARMPELIASMDCLLLPYRISEHTRFVFPIKFFEFLASGKPIVSAPLPSLAEYGALVPFVWTPEAWVGAVKAELASGGARRETRLELARANTWEHRAARLERIMQGYLIGQPPVPA